MTRVTSAGVVLLMLMSMLASSGTSVSAASEYYPKTGHYLYGQFQDYWNGNGGLFRFGYPITKVFNQKSTNGQTYPTQYLERAVFEQHPENKGTQFEVLGRLLGVIQAGPKVQTDPNFKPVSKPTDGRLFFDTTNHSIGGSDPGNAAIRSYWEAAGNGNVQQSIIVFGYPISEPFDEQNAPVPAGDGQMHRVQYFERYRLEYHPENQDPYRVLIGLLGQTQAKNDNLDPTLLATEPPNQQQPDCIGQGPCGATSGQPLPKSYAGLHIGDGADGYGFNTDGKGLNASDQNIMFGKFAEAQFGWLREQIIWDAYEPSKSGFANNYVQQVDTLINNTSAKGIKIMLSIVHAPGWAGGPGLPSNPQDMADLMNYMANRYKGKVAAYEIWNEENYAQETGGQVSIGAYPPILKAAYKALKASDGNITVVFGGMTPTGVEDSGVALNEVKYLQQLYQQFPDVKNYYDVLGAHPGSNCNPPDNSPSNPPSNPCGTDVGGGRSYTGDNSFYFDRIQELYAVMQQNGEGGKKMWLTEFGWDSTPNPPDAYKYAKYVSEDQQATYITRAFALGKSYPWMGVMFIWNLNFQVSTPPDNEKYGWGILHSDWSPRPAFTAVKSMPK